MGRSPVDEVAYRAGPTSQELLERIFIALNYPMSPSSRHVVRCQSLAKILIHARSLMRVADDVARQGEVERLITASRRTRVWQDGPGTSGEDWG